MKIQIPNPRREFGMTTALCRSGGTDGVRILATLASLVVHTASL